MTVAKLVSAARDARGVLVISVFVDALILQPALVSIGNRAQRANDDRVQSVERRVHANTSARYGTDTGIVNQSLPANA